MNYSFYFTASQTSTIFPSMWQIQRAPTHDFFVVIIVSAWLANFLHFALAKRATIACKRATGQVMGQTMCPQTEFKI